MVRDRVMVIDDDNDFRELMEVFLSSWGLTCVSARDCGQALSLLERERGRLRVVLLDYFMPGPPPDTCLRAILERLDPSVPVVLMSAALDIAERAKELGLQSFLAKPFETDRLRELLVGGNGRARAGEPTELNLQDRRGRA
jgi:DNA-binding NtrC family response regulator